MKKLINFTGQASPHLSRKLTYLMLLLITLMGGTGSAWADDVVSATQTITNDGKTSTWTSITATVAKNSSCASNGLYFVAGSSGDISTPSGSVNIKTGRIMYVQVPSATSTGSITIVGSNDNYSGSDIRNVSLNSGTTIAMKKSDGGSSGNFVISDIENVNNGYYIKLSSNSDFKFTQVSVTLTSSDSYSSSSTPGKTTLAGGHIYEKIYIGKGSNTFTPSTADNQLKITKGGSAAVYNTDYTMSYALPSGSSVELTNTTSGAIRSTNTLGESTVTATVTPTDAETYSGFTFPFTYVVTDRKSLNTGVDGLTALVKAWTWTPEDVANGRYYQDYHAGDGVNDYIFVKSSDTSNSGVRAKLQSNSQIAFILGAKMDVTISSNKASDRHLVISTADNTENVVQSGNDNVESHTFTLEAGIYYIGAQKTDNSVTQLYVKSIQFTPHVDKLSADFTYGSTSWTSPETDEMTITIPAHKANQNFNVTVNPGTYSLGTIVNGSNSGNTVTIAAPAAGSNKTVTIPVTDGVNTTNYTIKVNTETATGIAFDPLHRYSKDVIDANIGAFYSNTTATALAVYNGDSKTSDRSGKAADLDYVPGLVAKALVEAADYYQNEDYAKGWFNSVAEYANAKYNSVPTSGGSLDDLNAVKMYFGVAELSKTGAKFENSTTYSNAQTAMGKALEGLTAHNNSYSIGAGTLAGSAVEGGWFHKSTYNNQMWLDGQYMGPALLAQLNNYEKNISGSADWDLITKQFEISWNQLWNSTDKLLYHAFEANAGAGTGDNLTKSKANTWAGLSATSPYVFHSAEYWGRANGWYFLALVDVLEQMDKAKVSKSDANYVKLKGYLTNLAAGLAARQDATTGCWYQLLGHDGTFSAQGYANGVSNQARVYNFLESSATAIYAAAFLKGTRLGYFNYGTVGVNAYKGIIQNFMTDDYKIYWCSRSAGLGGTSSDNDQDAKKFRNGSAEYYLKGYDVTPTKVTDDNSKKDETLSYTLYKGTEGKALGAFIMAATEYERAYIHDVTYVSGPEGTAPAKSVAVNTLPDVQPTDVKSGYTFNGWYKADGTKVNVGDAVTDNLTLYANYTFAGAEKFSMTVKSGQTVNVPTGTTNNPKALSSTELDMTDGASAEVKNGHASNAADMVSNGQINLAGSGGSYLHITLPANLEEGDVINITNPGVFYLSHTETKGQDKIEGGVYTVTSIDNFHNQKELYIWKDNAGASVFSKVTVTSPSTLVTDITLDKTKVYLNYSETVQLNATVAPDNAANKNVNWSSSAVGIATVSETGLVTSKNTYGGITTITATAADGSGVSADCQVNYYRFSPSGGTNGKQDYKLGESGQVKYIQAEFYDGEKLALDKNDFEVTSSNTAAITAGIHGFSNNKVSLDITVGSTAGNATVTVRYKGSNPNYLDKECVLEYTVVAASAEKTPTAVEGGTIEGTTITASTVSAVNAGKPQTLTLTLPVGATATMKDAAGTSAEITSAGVLTYNALAVGTNQNITITITAEDNSTQDYIVALSTADAGAAIEGSIKWLDMASTGHHADNAGTATSVGITPADGKVVGLSANSKSDKIKVGDETATYYRYAGFAQSVDNDKYFEYSFNVASGYTFTPSDIKIAWSPNGGGAVSFDVYVGTDANSLTKVTTLNHTSDNIFREDTYAYTTPFTILRLVPYGKNSSSIVLNSVVINGQVTEPAATAHTVTFNLNGHSTSAIGDNPKTEGDVGAGVDLPKPIPYAGYTFLGWSVDQNATKADDGLYAFIPTYYPVSDVTLYAVYRQNPIGSAHTEWWHAFSDFTKLEVNKAYTATFNLTGGSHAYYNNWALVATSNDTGHYGDGVQNNGDNELFVLRGDGGNWGQKTGSSQLYKYNAETSVYDEITVNDGSTDEVKAAFIEDMANANVKVSAARAGKKVQVYATAECENGAKYVLTFTSGEYEGDMYLSFSTDWSSLGGFTADAESSANFLKKANDIEGGTVDQLLSLEGIDITGWGVAEGTQFTAVVTPADGYTFKNITINGVDAGSGILTMPDVEATVSAVFDSKPAAQYSYTVKAVGPNNVVLNENLASGTYTVGGAAITVAYPQHILVDNDLYEINKQYNGSSDYYRYTFTPDSANYVVNLPYTKNKVSNVVAYVEAENITGFTATTGNVNRASNGAAARSADSKTTGVTLETGKTYQIFFRMVNGDNARTVTFNDGTNNIYSENVAKADYSTKSSDLFSVSANTELRVSCAGSGSSGLDWFYVQEVNVLTVSSNGQKYGFTQDNVEAYKYASANAASVSSSNTYDGVTGKFYNIKNTSNYVEVTETGAIAFTVYAFHSNTTATRNVKVYVDGEEVGTVSVTPGGVTSSVFTIPAPQNGIHTIKMTGAGSDVYVADVVFYTSKVNPSVTPANVSVSVLQQKQFSISAPDGCDITSMDAVSSDVADVAYADGKITVTGKKPGNVTATFHVTSENDLFDSGTATVNITVTKAQLVMKYNPDAVIIEKGATKELPAGLKIDYYVVEDGVERLLDAAPVTPNSYTTTDNTVADVNATTGVINWGSSAGGTDITASFAGNDLYTAADASLSILVKDGFEYKVSGSDGDAGPSLDDDTRKFEVKNGSEVLVYGTFGGWKRNEHLTMNAKKADGWQALATYNNAIDGYSKYTSGINDAQDEDLSPSDGVIYGSIRKGWFESPITGFDSEGKPKVTKPTAPFSLPVRGTYMTFEPTKNGQLTVYILQNGAWNSSKKDVKDDDGFLVSVDENGQAIAFPGMAPWQFRPHSFYVVDQNGMPVEVYTKFDINTKQPIQSGIISEGALDYKDSKGKYTYTEAQRNMVRAYCEKYGVKLGEKFKCIIDPAADGYNDATNIGNWKEFKQYMSEDEQKRVAAAWNTGVNGAEQIVKLDNGSYLAVDECIMKYSFHVAAGQTYYLFSNFSKMGFSGCNFIPDNTPGAQPTATLALSDKELYTAPVLGDVDASSNSNRVSKITVPQYAEISLNRTFAAGNWNTIYLPFVMTEKEVRDVFGKSTQLILLDNTVVDESGVLELQFVYHEIQSILAGYPYLIKPSQTVNAGDIIVCNKVLDPDATQMVFTCGDYSAHGTVNYCTPDPANRNYAAKLDKGDIYINGGNLYVAGDTPVYSKGYRAYIDYIGTAQGAKEVRLTMRGGGGNNDQTTDIDIVQLTDEAVESLGINRIVNGVYNINGQKISGSTKNLPAGVYIVNGKKMVVK